MLRLEIQAEIEISHPESVKQQLSLSVPEQYVVGVKKKRSIDSPPLLTVSISTGRGCSLPRARGVVRCRNTSLHGRTEKITQAGRSKPLATGGYSVLCPALLRGASYPSLRPWGPAEPREDEAHPPGKQFITERQRRPALPPYCSVHNSSRGASSLPTAQKSHLRLEESRCSPPVSQQPRRRRLGTARAQLARARVQAGTPQAALPRLHGACSEEQHKDL